MSELELLEQYKLNAKAWFDSLQTRIVAAFEALEEEAPPELYPGEPGQFELKPWIREAGGGEDDGHSARSRLFEKCGVHVSLVHGPVTAQMAQVMPGQEGKTFVATGISLIAHMVNPRVPAVHMNTRFILRRRSSSAFGGGRRHLTPLMEEQRSQEIRRCRRLPHRL